MDKPDDLLAEVIRDAELVAAYGGRCGRLRGVELVTALAEVQRLPKPSWADVQVIRMQIALRDAMGDIAPVLINDLRDPDWHPFAPVSRGLKTTGNLLFVAFAVLLLALTGCSTLSYNRGFTLNDEINTYLAARSQDHIVMLVNRLLDGRVSGTDYAVTVAELKEIGEAVALYGNRTTAFLREFNAIQLLLVPPAVAATSDTLPGLDHCAGANVGDARKWQASLRSAPIEAPKGQSIAVLQFAALCNENLPPALLYSATSSTFAYKIRDALDPWRSLILPALYGAFGAIVFYMRRVLDPSIPDPSLSRITARIAVGAFAGVIITWFWAPNNVVLETISSAGLTLFTLAFLVGFAVEVLFVLLDRLVAAAMAIAHRSDNRPIIAPVYVPIPERSDTKTDKKPDEKSGDNPPDGAAPAPTS